MKDSPFSEAWWLDAATEGRYETVTFSKEGGMSIALPVFPVRKFGMTSLCQPPYTRTLSPEIAVPPSGDFKRAHNIRHLVEILVTRLPDHDNFSMVFDPGSEAIFPFSLCGFEVSGEYTFQVPAELARADLMKNMDQKTRNLIRTTLKKTPIVEEASCAAFIETSREQRADDNHFQYEPIERIFSECVSRGQGVALKALDDAGQAMGTALLVWGARTMYYWQSARSPKRSNAGTNAALMWRALELAGDKGLTFNFDSFGSINNAKVLASFGIAPCLRPSISRRTKRYQLFKSARQLLVA